ncbi:hypothetical protein F7018_11480 [Tenacibaculum aiptasiae]|uniref:Lipoprotein n=1 Tax=Tenacibaculum aiptasiae TaxID=426481 RepID=A0A7J5AEK9_9FLAO|nr:hypothetical protein [Tenacibaculum aiptasiae]KAB1155923.1 hypothetical protein F7018_11480 [Tenacibaculum aiptasiae]
MKNILLTLLTLALISCNQLTKKVENSFSIMGVKLDSLNQVEEKKIKKLFNEINSRRINKYEGENSALIYHSVIKHNRIVDSLIIKLKSIEKNDSNKKKIVKRFEYTKTDLRNKLNTVKKLNTKIKIDSLLKPSDDLEILPKFAIISEFQSGKLNATKSAELLLMNLYNKTKNEPNPHI